MYYIMNYDGMTLSIDGRFTYCVDETLFFETIEEATEESKNYKYCEVKEN